ncbi:hypothetical protein ACFDR9_000343 [Janthinobacterium sp. CG_23.3]|uniref:hypothetical protein n=1 Tax=unclassified Janthinobacterium TaxID=2610881 RepID=UPI00034DB161|nr:MULTISPECIES: hypothetical protein [unclassified Janthinobacterium]MEC5160976.1 hypothetical protein [Janthinobacterium sp. CG_S6]
MKRNILRLWLILPALCACLALLGACGAASSAADNPPAGSVTHVMAVGQSVAVTPTATLKLDRVNDSRCKTGAVCVWAGYVSYSFTLSDGTGASSFTLSDSMPGGSPEVTQQKLTFTLVSVDPAAPPALHAPEPHYRVTVKVTIS